MALIIESSCGLFRAVVEENDNGCEAKYFRSILSDARGKLPGNVYPLRLWRFERTSQMPVPFHVALDMATRIVEHSSKTRLTMAP